MRIFIVVNSIIECRVSYLSVVAERKKVEEPGKEIEHKKLAYK